MPLGIIRGDFRCAFNCPARGPWLEDSDRKVGVNIYILIDISKPNLMRVCPMSTGHPSAYVLLHIMIQHRDEFMSRVNKYKVWTFVL